MTKKNKKIRVNLLLIIILGIFLIVGFNILIKMLFGMAFMLISLSELFRLADINTKLLGGFLFLFVFWSVFKIFAFIWGKVSITFIKLSGVFSK